MYIASLQKYLSVCRVCAALLFGVLLIACDPALEQKRASIALGSAAADVQMQALHEAKPSDGLRLIPLSPLPPSASQVGDPLYPSDTCDTESCRLLLSKIEGAEHKIDFAIYGIRRQPKLFAALVAAKQRGVEVRGVVDRNKEGDYEYSDTSALVEALKTVRADEAPQKKSATQKRHRASDAAKDASETASYTKKSQDGAMSAPVTTEVYDDALMHNKFFVIDERWVWTASANLSDTDITGYNANLIVWIDSPEVAAQYTREFEQMYLQGRFHRQKRVNLLRPVSIGDEHVQVFFPPKGDAFKAVSAKINDAKKSIDVAIFYLTHKDLARDLIAAHRRGVRVRVILDATAARNRYSAHTQIRDASIPLKVENWGGKMHAKSAVIDGRFVIAGSMNWTKAGFGKNDENLLILDSVEEAARYAEWFEVLWVSIPERWLREDPDPESWDSGVSCTDGIDNDFNRRTDAGQASCVEEFKFKSEKRSKSTETGQ